MKKNVLVGLLVAGLSFAAACGSSSSTNTPEITDLSQLPKATSPMAAASAANVASPIRSIKGDLKANAATTGLNVRTTDSSAFNYASSMGSCNTFNVVKQGISSASQADMILCFISQMNSAFSSSGVLNPDGAAVAVDIYDGQYHIFNMNMVGDEGAPDRIKMKIVKTGNSITDFKMWMCKRTGDTLYQNEYTDQAISGSNISMTALGRYSEGGNTGWHHVAVTGAMNTGRAYTTKTITTKNWSTNATDPTNWSEAILTQTPGAFSFSGYNKGSFEGGTYQDTAVGLGQMIGDADAFTALAMGDGAVKYAQSGTSQQGDYSQDGVNGWNGDTTYPEAAADNDYYATADASTYSTPEVQSSITTGWIGFSTDQTWDCTDDVGVGIYTLPETNYSTVSAECDEYTFDHNWINCYEDIGMCNGDNVCAGRTGDELTNCRSCFTDGTARKAGTETETCLNTFFPGDWTQMCPPLS